MPPEPGINADETGDEELERRRHLLRQGPDHRHARARETRAEQSARLSLWTRVFVALLAVVALLILVIVPALIAAR